MLLVEPWFSGSHRAWAEGLRQHSRYRIELLTRQPAGWRRTLEQSAGELAARAGPLPDVVLASSMMDLAEFRLQARLAHVPTLLYLHENQLTYDRAKPDLASGAINWRSVEAADRVAFNSRFHLEDFFAAVPELGVPGQAIEAARGKSLVLPVGIDAPDHPRPARPDAGSPVVLWNHRWEADKDPAAFGEALLAVADLSFRLILAGEGEGAQDLADQFGDRVLHAGFATETEYPALLSSADLVVSTAHQEFFGVSIAEAMAHGAVPLVPNRLAYPELLGPGLAGCLYEPGTLPRRLRSMLADPSARESLTAVAQAAGGRFDWRLIAPRYDEVIASMV